MSDTKQKGAVDKLTRNKVEELLETGMLQQDIARNIGISEASVSYHVRRIKTSKIRAIKGQSQSISLVSNKILSDNELNELKLGKLEVLNRHLSTELPMLKGIKEKMKHYDALRPVEVALKRKKVNELIDLGASVIEDELKAHKSQEKTLSPRDIAGLIGTLNNIASLIERQSDKVTPKTIDDLPIHKMYATADQKVIDVEVNDQHLI